MDALGVATGVALIVVVVALSMYLLGRHQQRVCAWGRDTYIRFYPNPGVGLCLGRVRVALSAYGGLEVFRRHPRTVWWRVRAWGSRVKRPAGDV